MEIKINREIRNYTETVFFGLTLRQFLCSVLSCGTAVLLYFLLRPYLGTEVLSWICILGAAPFALLGFLKYNGMPAERFLLAWIRSELLTPKELACRPKNIYYVILKPWMSKNEKEEKCEYDPNFKNDPRAE